MDGWMDGLTGVCIRQLPIMCEYLAPMLYVRKWFHFYVQRLRGEGRKNPWQWENLWAGLVLGRRDQVALLYGTLDWNATWMLTALASDCHCRRIDAFTIFWLQLAVPSCTFKSDNRIEAIWSGLYEVILIRSDQHLQLLPVYAESNRCKSLRLDCIFA